MRAGAMTASFIPRSNAYKEHPSINKFHIYRWAKEVYSISVCMVERVPGLGRASEHMEWIN